MPDRRENLDVQPLLRIVNDFIAHVAVSLHSATVHSRQHQNVGIDVVVDLNDSLGVVKSMKSPDVLLKRSLPRNRHRQEQRIEPGVIESFADVASRRKD